MSLGCMGRSSLSQIYLALSTFQSMRGEKRNMSLILKDFDLLNSAKLRVMVKMTLLMPKNWSMPYLAPMEKPRLFCWLKESSAASLSEGIKRRFISLAISGGNRPVA